MAHAWCEHHEGITRRDLIKGIGGIAVGIAAAGAISSIQLPEAAYAATKASSGRSRIHIMAFESQDAIVLESNGHFGIVDSGEDASYPDGSDSRYPLRFRITTDSAHAHEREFVSYLKKIGAKRGNVDFYIGTHPHSDHIGSAPLIIDTFKPKRVYTPAYKDKYVTGWLWDNLYVYDRLVAAARRNGCKLYTNLKGRESLTLGDMKITLFNTSGYYKKHPVLDANDMSLGVTVEANGVRAFLAGDIEDREGLEDKIAATVGKVDLLKAGHHGYENTSSTRLLSALSPEVIYVTNSLGSMGPTPFAHMRKASCILGYRERMLELDRTAAVFELSAEGLKMDGRILPTFAKTKKGLVAKRHGKACSYTGLVSRGGNWYLFRHSSKCIRSKWVKIAGAWYYFKKNGTMARGFAKAGRTTYYLDPKSGKMQTGWLKKSGKWYYLDGSGAMATGWKKVDGTWYKFAKNGVWQSGDLAV